MTMIFENVISKILSQEIALDDVTTWLISSKSTVEVFQGSHRIDFANFFLAFLREQACVLESKLAKTPSNTPVKCLKTLPLLEFENAGRRTQQRRICSRKLPMGSENNTERTSPEFQDGSSRRTQKPQSRLGPQSVPFASFIVPKTSQREKKIARANLKLDSNEEFPEIGVVKKRVHPVTVPFSAKVCEDKNCAPNPFTAAPEVHASDAVIDRTRLKLECLKFQARDSVTYKHNPEHGTKQLDILASIYTIILSNDLVLNFMSEFYFLMELLCVPIPLDEEQSKLLGCTQNCSYFSAKTLCSLRDVMQHLDVATIRLLAENSILDDACPDLVSHLRQLIPSLQNKNLIHLNSIIGVQVDNENKKNFSTPDSFQVYRRQRDGFYTLLEDWDKERQFTKGLSKETLAIFEHFPMEPENLAYFSRLFVAQLICSCIGDGPNGMNKTPLDLQVDPERLKKLHERLVTPARALSGPCPPPEFSGWEEFFRDFIVIAANMMFNQHLLDALASKLHELESQHFSHDELQPKVLVVEEETRNKYLACVVSAQLVSKFLGFVQFYSYKPMASGTKLSEQSVIAQVSLRENLNPVINTQEFLENAEKSSRLILTIPWLCSFIAQLDPVSLRLPVFQATLTSMIAILRSLPHRAMPRAAALLIRLNIGWCLANLTECCPSIWSIFRNSPSARGYAKEANSIDELDLVDSRTLGLVCPFILELRTILSGNCGNSKTGQSIGPKHITPIAAVSGDPVLQLELHLEASFIQTQPTNVRQTIEFVTERMTSLCTTHLQETVIVSEIQTLEMEVQDKVQCEAKNLDACLTFSETVSSLKKNLEFWSSTASDEHLVRLSKSCLDAGHIFVNDRCLSLLKQLLPSTISSVQCDAFALIICKNVCDKIRSWLQTTFGPADMQKKLKDSVEKAVKQRARTPMDQPLTPKQELQLSLRLPTDRQGVVHNESVVCPAELLINIREFIVKLSNGGSASEAEIEALLSSIGAVLQFRGDLIPVAHSILQPLTVDLMMTLITYCPGEFKGNVIANFVKLWLGPLGQPDQLDRIMCPRHMHLMFSSKDYQLSWSSLTKLLQCLIKLNLLTPAEIEEQAVAVLQQEWPSIFLEMYSLCINNLVRDAGSPQKSEGGDSSFSQLLPWLADYCSNLEDLPDD